MPESTAAGETPNASKETETGGDSEDVGKVEKVATDDNQGKEEEDEGAVKEEEKHHKKHHHKKHHHHHHHHKKHHSEKRADPEGYDVDESAYENVISRGKNPPLAPLGTPTSPTKGLSIDPEGVEVSEAMYYANKAEESKSVPANDNTSNDKHKGTRNNDEKDEKKEPDPLASITDVFQFAQTTKIKLCLAIGMFCSVVSGCSFPALAWVFADSFEKLTGINVGMLTKHDTRLCLHRCSHDNPVFSLQCYYRGL